MGRWGLDWTELLAQTAPWTLQLSLFAGAPVPHPFSADPSSLGSWDHKATESSCSQHCPAVSSRDVCRHSHVVKHTG